jgi:hypothetical protein
MFGLLSPNVITITHEVQRQLGHSMDMYGKIGRT